MKHTTWLAGVVAAATVQCGTLVAATSEFSFTAEEYAVGEALSQKGVTGGATWTVGDASATNVSHSGVNAIDMAFAGDTDEILLVSDLSRTTNATRTVILQLGSQEEYDFVLPPISGAASIYPARFADGTKGFYGWGDGRWNKIGGASDWDTALFWCRFELKTIGDVRYVRYSVKSEGEAWVVLKTCGGKEWFATKHEELKSRVGFRGNGQVASVGVGSDAAEEALATFHWTGGDAGAWDDTNNWVKVEGAGADRAPGLNGDLAIVAGEVTIDGVKTRNLTVTYDEDGVGTAIGGKILGEVTLDTDRPRAGDTLEAETATLFGRRADYDYTWYRGGHSKDYDAHAYGDALTLAAEDYEHWYKLVAMEDGTNAVYRREFYFSKLPVCYLTTEGGVSPPMTKEALAGTMRMQGGEEHGLQYDGATEIKLRGNSTLQYPKKAYKLKLDSKANMFKMGKNKHWVLLANYNDMANQRNKLAYDLANDIGSLGMDSTWVVCTLNGEYKGLYQFAEHIRPDEKRVPIDEENDTLLEFSTEMDEIANFITTSGKLKMRTMFNSPEEPTEERYDCVTNFFQEYWDACTSSNRCCAKTGKKYADYCDLDSMALYTLVNELFTNYDAPKKSRYAYIKDGKLVWGPVWDFDWGSNSVRVKDDYDQWVTCGQSHRGDDLQVWAESQSMMKEWYSDSDFCRRIYKLYWKNRARFGRIVADGGDIDTNEAYLTTAALTDDARWQSQRTTGGIFRTSADDTAILKQHLIDRLAWLDAQFASPKSVHDSVRAAVEKIQSAPSVYTDLGLMWYFE